MPEEEMHISALCRDVIKSMAVTYVRTMTHSTLVYAILINTIDCFSLLGKYLRGKPPETSYFHVSN